MRSLERLTLAHLWVAFAAFIVACFFGVWQMWARSPLPAPFVTPDHYFLSVTAHGVSMAFVLTTFFIMGFGYFTAETALGRPLPGIHWAWLAFVIALAGALMATVAILSGRASVLYTFYPPLMASPIFYFGLVLVVVGSWIWCVLMIVAMSRWKHANPGAPVPLAMYATVANAVMWLWTTIGVAAELLFIVLPASMGWNDTVDVGLTRTLFSWTLHPIVYFWLFPAYIAFYTMAPQAAGGRLYSDTLGRLSFVLLLLYSLPVGMHHLLMDPMQSTGFKFVQMMLTILVVCADTSHGLHNCGLDGDCWPSARRTRPLRLDSGSAMGAPHGARDRTIVRHALLWRRWRTRKHGLRPQCAHTQHVLGDGAFPFDLRWRRRDHVFRYLPMRYGFR